MLPDRVGGIVHRGREAGGGDTRNQTAAPALVADDQLPYVYTKWQQFTVKDGLPNDHIFAVKADGDCVWVGTDDGLSLIDKRAGKVDQVWKEEDGLPWRVVTGIEVDPISGDVWLGLFGKGLARLSGGRFDHFHQLNSGLVNDVVYAMAMEGDNVWSATTAGSSRYNTKTKKGTSSPKRTRPWRRSGTTTSPSGGRQDVSGGLGQWGPGVRLKKDLNGSVENVPGSGRRNGNRPLPRRRQRARDHHRSQSRGQRVLGLDLLRLLPL